jgi:hypothetical protein
MFARCPFWLASIPSDHCHPRIAAVYSRLGAEYVEESACMLHGSCSSCDDSMVCRSLQHVSHRALMGCATGLCRCQVPASLWLKPIFASLQHQDRPHLSTMNLNILLPIAESEWFIDNANKKDKDIVTKILKQGDVDGMSNVCSF